MRGRRKRRKHDFDSRDEIFNYFWFRRSIPGCGTPNAVYLFQKVDKQSGNGVCRFFRNHWLSAFWPSLALKKESGLDGHYPEGPPDLWVLTQQTYQFLWSALKITFFRLQFTAFLRAFFMRRITYLSWKLTLQIQKRSLIRGAHKTDLYRIRKRLSLSFHFCQKFHAGVS